MRVLHGFYSEKGNILFLILLAIVLFAALAYAVTNMLRGGGKDAGQDKADILATQILENAALAESTILRAQVMNGIPDWGFDFSRGISPSNLTANGTCTQQACKLFVDNGGGVPYIIMPEWATTTTGSGTMPRFWVAKVLGMGTDTNDVVYGYDSLSLSLCEAINRKLNLTDINMTLADGIGNGSYIYSGTLTAMPAATGILGDANPTLIGKRAACYLAQANQYRFTYVVMER